MANGDPHLWFHEMASNCGAKPHMGGRRRVSIVRDPLLAGYDAGDVVKDEPESNVPSRMKFESGGGT